VFECLDIVHMLNGTYWEWFGLDVLRDAPSKLASSYAIHINLAPITPDSKSLVFKSCIMLEVI